MLWFRNVDGVLFMETESARVNLFTPIANLVCMPVSSLLNFCRNHASKKDPILKDIISSMVCNGIQFFVSKEDFVDKRQGQVVVQTEWDDSLLLSRSSPCDFLGTLYFYVSVDISEYLFPLALQPIVVFETGLNYLRICTVFEEQARVHLFENEVLRRRGDISGSESIYIDVSSSKKWPAETNIRGVECLVNVILSRFLSLTSEESQSIVGELLGGALAWKYAFHKQWHLTAHDFVSNIEQFPNALLPFVRPEIIDEIMVRNTTAFGLISRSYRRLIRPSIAFDANKFGINNFKVLPFEKDVFKRLQSLEFFDHRYDACELGLLTRTSPPNAVFPYDVTERDIVTMLYTMIPIRDVFIDRFVFSKTYTQTTCLAMDNDVYWPYRLFIDDDGFFIERDFDTSERIGESAISIDVFDRQDIETSPDRIDEATIQSVFPATFKRLQEWENKVDGICFEIQARKLCLSWRLEDVDGGGNLNSLGLCLLLSFLLSAYVGARTRLFLSSSQSALAGLWQNGTWMLISTSSSKNGFDIPTLSRKEQRQADRTEEQRLHKGRFIEVRMRSKWYVAMIKKILKANVEGQVDHIRFVNINNQAVDSIPCSSRSWRIIDCKDSDLHAILSFATRERSLKHRARDQTLSVVPLRFADALPSSVSKE